MNEEEYLTYFFQKYLFIYEFKITNNSSLFKEAPPTNTPENILFYIEYIFTSFQSLPIHHTLAAWFLQEYSWYLVLLTPFQLFV